MNERIALLLRAQMLSGDRQDRRDIWACDSIFAGVCAVTAMTALL
jgi:hypothetical protein